MWETVCVRVYCVAHTNLWEFIEACEERGLTLDTSTPRRSKTNGFVERTVRRVKEITAVT